MTLLRATLTAALFVLFAAAASPALAQPTGNLVRGLGGETADSFRITRSNRTEIRTVKSLTLDGELSPEDLAEVIESAGRRVSPEEMAVVRLALTGKVPGGPDFDVPDATRDAAVDMLYTVNLFDASRDALKDGDSYGGTEIPLTVKQVVARAKLNGAVAYDVTEKDEDGEGVYSHYPSVTPATENMAFAWTEVTPGSLQADMDDTDEHLRISGSRSVTLEDEPFSVANYTTMTGGTGSISAAYDEVFHPVRQFGATILKSLGYPEDLDVDAVRGARSSSGNKWSSNCAILSDGTFHCLPAVRRHSASSGLILTNPALARGQQLLWNGHLRVDRGKVVYVGTSGGIAKRAARGRDIFVNPLPLLKAWGFELADGLQVTSEHGTARPALDDDRAIMFETPAAE